MNSTLTAEIRQDTGKGIARKLRASGLVPAVIYAAGGEARTVSVKPKPLLDIFRKTRNPNTILSLDVDGETVQVLVKEAQRHPVSRDLIHVDFLEVAPDRLIDVVVKVRPVGKPAGASIGGRIRIIRPVLHARCTYDKIPEFFDVDVTPMNIGDIVLASEVVAPEGVTIIRKNDFQVVSCYGKRR